MEILYEDNHIIAVNKKSSEIVQADKTKDEPMPDRLKAYIKEKYNKPGDVYLATVHRIDRPVSGVVIFAKTSKAAERLSELFKGREVHKTYWAIVKKQPPKVTDVLRHYLWKNEKQNKSYAVLEPKTGYLESVLKYELIDKSDGYHLIKVNPLSGRHHQIRVQLSSIGCVIKGDIKYGSDRTNKDASISLHARSISFKHPVKDEIITITAPVPNDNLWKFFEESQAQKNASIDNN
jgi:23S rRNA pseudouridine1911/1915/1917 synthase